MAEGAVVGEAERRVIGEREVAALGKLATESAGDEAADHPVAPRAVVAAELLEVGVGRGKGGGGGDLERRRRAEGRELVRRADPGGEAGGRDRPADLPAREREALAEAAEDDGPLAEAGLERERPVRDVEPEFLVDLVAEDDEVVLDRDARDDGALLGVEDAAARIVRRVDDDHPRPGRDGRADRRLVDAEPGRLERHDARYPARDLDARGVRVVVRLEEDDLVARIEEAGHAVEDRLGRAAGDDDLALAIAGKSARPREARGDRGGELGQAGHARVLAAAVADRLDRGLLHELRAVEVGRPLPEVDRSVLDREGRHLGEDGGAVGRETTVDSGRTHGGESTRGADRG